MKNHRKGKFFSVFVVLVLSSSACSLLARPEPTPTPTPEPTDTPTPSPTDTPAPTATIETTEPVASEACSLLPYDQVSEWIDPAALPYEGSSGMYAMTFAEDWTVIDLSADDVDAIFTETIELFPELEDTLQSFLDQPEGSGLQMLAVYTKISVASGDFVPTMNILYVEDPLSAIFPLEFLTEQTAATMPNLLPTLTLLGTGLVENNAQTPLGLICSSIDMQEDGLVTFQKQALATNSGGMFVVSLVSTIETRDQFEPIFDALLHTLVIFDPPSDSQ